MLTFVFVFIAFSNSQRATTSLIHNDFCADSFELSPGGEFISELNAFQTMPAIDESIITHTESHNNAGANEHANAHTTTPGDVAAAWKSAVQNVPLEGKGGAAGEDDLIDEQQLLTDESLAVTKVMNICIYTFVCTCTNVHVHSAICSCMIIYLCMYT